MEKNFRDMERAFREDIEKQGKVRWATTEDPLIVESYTTLVDIFGNELRSDEKSPIVMAMMRNSCYSKDFRDRIGGKPPVTICRNPNLAVCVYPIQPQVNSYIHEGIHFLGNYGDKEKRIVRSDVPMAKIMDVFYQLRMNPGKLEEFAGETSRESIKRINVNPFYDRYEEHSDEEVNESLLTGIKAYMISEEKGEKAGIDYIVNLMREAEQNG